MKVLDLRCAQDHRFEGWFASDEDEASQRERGLLACPLCGDDDVQRLPSAPRLNLSAARATERTRTARARRPAGAVAARDAQGDCQY